MLRGERPSGAVLRTAGGTIWVDFLRRSCKVSPVSDEAWPRLTRGANAFWRFSHDSRFRIAGPARRTSPPADPKHQSEPVSLQPRFLI